MGSSNVRDKKRRKQDDNARLGNSLIEEATIALKNISDGKRNLAVPAKTDDMHSG